MIDRFKYPSYVTLSNMKELIQTIKKEDAAKAVCKEYALNIDMLHDLFEAQMRGFNNVQTAQKLGVHRVTIQRYTNTLKKLTESDFKLLYNYVLGEKDERDD